MNLPAIRKLVQDLGRFMMVGGDEATASRLAASYAQLCHAANVRLRQCTTVIEDGNPQQAIQIVESPPPLLEVIDVLTDPSTVEWRTYCRDYHLPEAEELHARSLAAIQDLYAKGVTPDHPLYKEYRKAIHRQDDLAAHSIIRSIVQYNPTDENAKRELERLDAKIMRDKLQRVEGLLRDGKTTEVLGEIEEVESLRLKARPEGPAWQKAKELHGRQLKEQAAVECQELIQKLATLREGDQHEKARPVLDRISTLQKERQVELPPDSEKALTEHRTWHAAKTKFLANRQRFEEAQTNLRRLASQPTDTLAPTARIESELNALNAQWADLQSFGREIPDDDETGYRQQVRRLAAQLALRARRRRMAYLAAAGTLLVAIVIVAWLLWRQQRSAEMAREIENLMAGGRVQSVEQRLRDLEAAPPARGTPLALAVERGRQWLRQEQERVRQFDAEAAALAGLQGVKPDDERAAQVLNHLVTADRLAGQMAEDDRLVASRQMNELLSAQEGLLGGIRRQRESAGEPVLTEAEKLAATRLAGAPSPEELQQAIPELSVRLERVRPSIQAEIQAVKLSPSFVSRYETLEKKLDSATQELARLTQLDETLRKAVTLDQHFETLGKIAGSPQSAPRSTQAALRMLECKPREDAILQAMLLPHDPEGWAAFVQKPDAGLFPTNEVTAAERNALLAIRDDENLQNIFVYKVRNFSKDGKIRTIYSREKLQTRKSSKTEEASRINETTQSGIVYDPEAFPSNLLFKASTLVCRENLTFIGTTGELAGDEQPARELDLYHRTGLNDLISGFSGGYQKSLLEILDIIHKDQTTNPVFKAYLELRIHEILALRPNEWGAHWVPDLLKHRQQLKSICGPDFRSGDWLIPQRTAELEPRLAAFYPTVAGGSYAKPAQLNSALARATLKAGLQFAGFVNMDGRPVLLPSLPQVSQLWGWSQLELKPQRLYRWDKASAGFKPVGTPQPYSPLYFARLDVEKQLQKSMVLYAVPPEEKDTLGALPPLYQLAREP